MTINTNKFLDGIPDIDSIVWGLRKKNLHYIVIPFLIGFITIKLGFIRNIELLINIGVISFCISFFVFIIIIIFSNNNAQKKFLQTVASLLGYEYSDYDVIFDKDSIFFHIRNEIFNYTKEEAKNSINGKYLCHFIKFYKYSMGIENVSNYAGSASYFNFFVLELKINHNIPNLICLPKKGHFEWPNKYKKSEYDGMLNKNFYLYIPDNKMDLSIKTLIKNITFSSLEISNEIGFEFSNNRVIVFQYGNKINKEKIEIFLNITKCIISNLEAFNSDSCEKTSFKLVA